MTKHHKENFIFALTKMDELFLVLRMDVYTQDTFDDFQIPVQTCQLLQVLLRNFLYSLVNLI